MSYYDDDDGFYDTILMDQYKEKMKESTKLQPVYIFVEGCSEEEAFPELLDIGIEENGIKLFNYGGITRLISSIEVFKKTIGYNIPIIVTYDNDIAGKEVIKKLKKSNLYNDLIILFPIPINLVVTYKDGSKGGTFEEMFEIEHFSKTYFSLCKEKYNVDLDLEEFRTIFDASQPWLSQHQQFLQRITSEEANISKTMLAYELTKNYYLETNSLTVKELEKKILETREKYPVREVYSNIEYNCINHTEHDTEREFYNKLHLKEIAGLYIPSFYCIKINQEFTQANCTNFHIPKTSTFLHEYIHYIQDISTLKGYQSLILSHKYYQYLLSEVVKNKHISLPFKLNIKKGYFEQNNYDEAIDNNHKNVKIINALEIIDYDSKSKKFTLMDYDTYDTISLKVGLISIVESMAYEFQKVLYHSFSLEHGQSPDYPYNICRLILEYFFKECSFTSEFIFVLCDACLMNEDPGNSFIRVIKRMRKDNIYSSNTDQLCKLISEEDIIQLDEFDRLYLSSKAVIKDSLAGRDDYFSKEKEWVLDTLDKAYNLRKKYPLLGKKIIDSKNRNYLEDIFKEVDTPIIIDKNNNMFISSNVMNDTDLSLYKSINDFCSYILGVSACFPRCPFFDECKANEPTRINDNCHNSPWDWEYNNGLCQFSKLWKRYGLSKNVVIRV